jgi:hypothetical protein
MRPVFDPRLFPGLPKFLWFDNGSGGDGGDGGDGSSSSSSSTSAADASSAAADAAAAGFGGVGGNTGAPAGTTTTATADNAFGGQAAPSGPAGGTSGGVASSVSFGGQGAANAGTTAGGGASTGGPGAATGGPGGGGPGAATGGAGGTGGPGAATGGGGGTASGGSGISGSVRSALQALLGGNPADALRGAVRNSAIDFGPPGVPSLGVPEGVGGQGAAPVGQVSVSPLGEPGPNLAQLAHQLFGSAAANAARGSIGTDTSSLFGPTNTTKGSGSSTATSANTGKAPGVGGAAVAGGTPSPADFGPARGAMGDVSTSAVTAPGVALGGGPGNASDSPTGTPGGAGAAPGTPSTSPAAPNVTSGLGPAAQVSATVNSPTDPTLAGKAPGYYGMTMGFPAVEGVSPGLTAAPAGPSQATQGGPAVALGGGPGNASESPTGTPAPSPGAVTGPDLAQVVTSLVSGGNAGPALAQLAATIFGAPRGYGVPGTNNFGNMTYQALQNFMGVDPSTVLAPSIGPQGPPGSPGSSAQSAQFGI